MLQEHELCQSPPSIAMPDPHKLPHVSQHNWPTGPLRLYAVCVHSAHAGKKVALTIQSWKCDTREGNKYVTDWSQSEVLWIFVLFYNIFIRYFLHLHLKCYPESSLYPPTTLFPYPPTPTSWSWHSPVLGHIKFARPRGISSQWWPTRPSSATYAARDTSSGGIA